MSSENSGRVNSVQAMNEQEVPSGEVKAEFVVATSDSTETGEEKIEVLDRISDLPEDIIHHILSYIANIGSIHLIKISMLSKHWNRLCASYPRLFFVQNCWLDSQDLLDNYTQRNGNFVNFVDRSMRRFNDLKMMDMHRFYLGITRLDTELGFHINDWVSLAIQNQVRRIFLSVLCAFYNRKFHVLSAEEIFSSKSLNELDLFGCKLELSRFNYNSILCPLQKLNLRVVYLDEDTMENIIRSCPLITTFCLSDVCGLKYLHISGLHSLEDLKVKSSIEIDLEKVYINAPRLRTFDFQVSRHCTFDFDVDRCEYLTRLTLAHPTMTDMSLQDILSRLPNLESLQLRLCMGLMKIMISCRKLQELVLDRCLNLSSISKFNVSDSFLFRYLGQINKIPFLESKNNKFHGRFDVLTGYALNAVWFLRLRQKLSSFDCKKSLYVTPYPRDPNSFDLKEIGEVPLSPPLEIENLTLTVLENSSLNYSALLDGFLWCCRPKKISVIFKSIGKFTEFPEELMAIEIQSFCSSSDIKCWRHYLEDITVESESWRNFSFGLTWRSTC